MTCDQPGISIVLQQVYLFNLTCHSNAIVEYPFKFDIRVFIHPGVKLIFGIHDLQTASGSYYHHNVMVDEHLLHVLMFGQETVELHAFSA